MCWMCLSIRHGCLACHSGDRYHGYATYEEPFTRSRDARRARATMPAHAVPGPLRPMEQALSGLGDSFFLSHPTPNSGSVSLVLKDARGHGGGTCLASPHPGDGAWGTGPRASSGRPVRCLRCPPLLLRHAPRSADWLPLPAWFV